MLEPLPRQGVLQKEKQVKVKNWQVWRMNICLWKNFPSHPYDSFCATFTLWGHAAKTSTSLPKKKKFFAVSMHHSNQPIAYCNAALYQFVKNSTSRFRLRYSLALLHLVIINIFFFASDHLVCLFLSLSQARRKRHIFADWCSFCDFFHFYFIFILHLG